MRLRSVTRPSAVAMPLQQDPIVSQIVRDTFGIRLCQSVARSYAAANRNTTASPPFGPLICNPIGSPLVLKPHGTEIVGIPYTSKGEVLRMYGAPRRMAVPLSLLISAMVGGGTGVVGVT